MLFEKQDYQEKCVGNIISILEKMDNFSGEDFFDLPTTKINAHISSFTDRIILAIIVEVKYKTDSKDFNLGYL